MIVGYGILASLILLVALIAFGHQSSDAEKRKLKRVEKTFDTAYETQSEVRSTANLAYWSVILGFMAALASCPGIFGYDFIFDNYSLKCIFLGALAIFVIDFVLLCNLIVKVQDKRDSK